MAKSQKRFSIWRIKFLHPEMWNGHNIDSPGDCTLQCGMWLWNPDSEFTLQCDTWLSDEMPLNSPKRPPYLNSTSGFDFDYITAVDMSFCTSLQNFIQIGPPSTEKNDVMSIFKKADLSHLGF